jgi:PAS domain S-box-containing protein
LTGTATTTYATWRFSLAVGALSVVVPVLVLIGWQFDVEVLKSVFPAAVSMKPNTALCVLLLGAALLASIDDIWPRRSRFGRALFVRASMLTTLIISGLTLAEYISGNSLGLDLMLFRKQLLAEGVELPGRISEASSTAIATLSIATVLLHSRSLLGKRIGQFLTLASMLVPFVALLGYIYGARHLYEFKPFATVAIHTAIVLLLISAGLLFARPERSIVSELLSPHNGGLMARRVLPFALTLPVVVGWARLVGQNQGLYGTEVGIALFATVNAFVFSALVWLTARSLNRVDAERRMSDYQAVLALRGAEARWRALVEASSQIVWTADRHGRSTEDSPSWRAFTGQTLEEAGDRRLEAIHPEDRPNVIATWRRAIKARAPFESEYRLRHVSGEWRWVSSRGIPLRAAGGIIETWVGMITDINDHKRAQSLAEGQKKVLEMIARDAPLTSTLEALTQLIDSQSDDMYSSILLLSADGKTLHHGAAPRLPPEYTSAIDGAVIGPAVGSCGTAAYTCKPVYVADIATDPLWKDFKHLALPHGLRACWSTPILDADGRVFGTFAIYYKRPGLPTPEHVALLDLANQTAAICLAHHREMEHRKRMQQSQLRSQKLEALGTLSGGIAHDFNNMLLVIAGNAKLAANMLGETHAAQTALTEIGQASARATDLVRRILAFSRPQTTRHKHIQLQPVITEALKLVRATLPAMIDIRTELDGNTAMVSADATQVHQVLVNLATNAAHAIGTQRGVIEVQLESLELTPQMPACGPDLRPGPYARLTVRDTGSGMTPEVMSRIFDPFFTTKPLGQGTGLGLSIVHGIMQSCGGAVRVESEVGVGTSFHLYFPAVMNAEARDPTGRHLALPGGGQHILLIDDEDALVRLGTILLTKQGYRVTGCTDPQSAIRQFRREPEAFHAVVTDLSMPGMSGFDCAKELLEVRPDIPIVLTSGYVRPEDEVTAKRVGIRTVVTKPAALDQLPQILAQVFAATA